MSNWEHVDAFVNLIHESGSTEQASARDILDWLLEEVANQFGSEGGEGWSSYKPQNFKSAVTFLKQCENDPSKKDRASTLKGQLFERIQNASEQNEKVTLSLYDLLKASNLSATALHVCSHLRFLVYSCLVCSRMSLPCLQLP